MKRLLALSAVAAVAVIAMSSFAASASAKTVVCGAEGATCPTGQVKPAGTFLTSGVSSSVSGTSIALGPNLLSGLRCTSLLMDTKLNEAAGNPLMASGENYLSAGTCSIVNQTHSVCSKASMGNAPEAIEPTGSGNGVIKMGTTAQPLVLSYECEEAPAKTWACAYRGTAVPLEIVPWAEPESKRATVKEAVMTLAENGSGNCAATAKLRISADYVSGYWISSAPPLTVVCGVGGGTCPTGQDMPAGTYLTSGVSSSVEGTSLSLGLGTGIYCTGLLMDTKSNEAAGSPLTASGENYLSAGTCQNLFHPKAVCSKASMGNTPETIEPTGSGNGVIKMGTRYQPLVISYECEESPTKRWACAYEGVAVPLQIHPWSEAKSAGATVKESLMTLTENGSGNCSTTAKLNIAADYVSNYSINTQ
jgi:hypothetical protein